MDPFERLEKLGQFRMKLGLGRIRRLMDTMGTPQLSVPSVHVAGTNGKGSTCHMLDSIMSEFPVNRSLYTSPHLLDIRERIRLNGADIDRITLRNTLEKVISISEDILEENDLPTYFEVLTAAFFLISGQSMSDLNIVEVGMGGRFDATNILEPLAVCITSIGLDHVEHLGDEEHAIAREKAGIIRPSTPVVLGPVHIDRLTGQRTMGAILDVCTSNGCPVVVVSPASDSGKVTEMMKERSIPDGRIISIENEPSGGPNISLSTSILIEDGPFEDRLSLLDDVLNDRFEPPLYGTSQIYNMACALALSLLSLPGAFSHGKIDQGDPDALNDLIEGCSDGLLKCYDIGEIKKKIRIGLSKTNVPGRSETFNFRGSEIMFDGGHNREAAASFAENVKNRFPGKRCVLLLSMMKDKDAGTYMEQMAPVISNVFLTRMDLDRCKPLEEMVSEVAWNELPDMDMHMRKEIDLALDDWSRMISPESPGLIGGSFYLYQPFMEWFRKPNSPSPFRP
jgi:folylpolyglutamate synthase/dihydropteroate synthase